jgi:hypothetical protein
MKEARRCTFLCDSYKWRMLNLLADHFRRSRCDVIRILINDLMRRFLKAQQVGLHSWNLIMLTACSVLSRQLKRSAILILGGQG